MSFKDLFIQSTKFYSGINQEMTLFKPLIGEWSLFGFGINLSGSYVENIWLGVFKIFNKSGFKPKDILLLGLGAGSAFFAAKKIWPQACLTGVDIDQTMIEISQKIYSPNFTRCLVNEFFRNQPATPKSAEISLPVKIFKIDALSFLKDNQDKFDLVLIDIFEGRRIAPVVLAKEFISWVRKALRTKGRVAVNFFEENTSVLPTWQQFFPHAKIIKIKYNHFISSELN